VTDAASGIIPRLDVARWQILRRALNDRRVAISVFPSHFLLRRH
jgi:hypothetical protein